jgi:hypothetical protein
MAEVTISLRIGLGLPLSGSADALVVDRMVVATTDNSNTMRIDFFMARSSCANVR